MLLKVIRAYREAFSGLPATVWVLALVWLINRAGAMVIPFLTLYVKKELHYSDLLAGLIIAFYGIGSSLGNFCGGYLTERFGAFRVQFFSLIGTANGFLLLSRMEDYVSFAITLVSTSFMAEVFRPANVAAIADSCPPGKHKRAFALNRLAVNLGFTIGPSLGGWLATYSYQFLFWVDAATCIAAAIVLWILLRHDPAAKRKLPVAQRDEVPARSPWSDGPYLVFLLLTLATFVVFFQIMVIFPLYLDEEFGLREWQIGLLMGLNTVVIVLFEMLLVHSIDHWNLLKTIAIGSCLMCQGFAILLLGQGFLLAALSVLVWTLGEMLAMPQMMAYASARSNERNRGRYMGLYTTTVSMAFVFAPLIGSRSYSIDHDLFWYVSAAVGLIVWIGFLLLDRLANPNGPADQSPGLDSTATAAR